MVHEAVDAEESKALERIELFSDAVIAIAITLLALDIRLPDAPLTDPAALRDALVALWPHYFAYILSFLVVGSFWIGHNRKFRLMRRSDSGLMWINLLFLMVIGFVPFASSVLSAHPNLTGYTLYDGTMIVASLLAAATSAYATWGNRLVDPETDSHARRAIIIGPLKMAAAFTVALILTYFIPHAARWAFWLLVPAVLNRGKRTRS